MFLDFEGKVHIYRFWIKNTGLILRKVRNDNSIFNILFNSLPDSVQADINSIFWRNCFYLFIFTGPEVAFQQIPQHRTSSLEKLLFFFQFHQISCFLFLTLFTTWLVTTFSTSINQQQPSLNNIKAKLFNNIKDSSVEERIQWIKESDCT